MQFATAAYALRVPVKPPPTVLVVKSQLSPSTVPSKAAESMAAKWAQKTIVLPPQKRGCHLITSEDDTETFLNRIVPEGRSAPWKHTMEGPDDMPAHIKSSMFGCSLTIPITDGRLNMGTWQGIWLCEHRDHTTPRKIVITLNGM